jgi:enoyl-CoA hydratase
MNVLSFPAPVVAAINGNAVAGGCLLSIACDRRVMTNDEVFRIGFNEIVKGIPLPAGPAELVRRHLKPGAFARTLSAACVVRPAEALKIGLVDRVEPSENVVVAALEMCAGLPGRSREEFREAKNARVAETLERVRERHASGSEPFVEDAQALLHGLKDRLMSKKADIPGNNP